jgi:dephospho-CoA kinase
MQAGRSHSRIVIGLTGGIGSGKTAVSDELARLGATVVDTDVIAHALTAPGGAALGDIATQFGAEFIDASGALNRARMRERVFGNPAAKAQLEGILHPLIRAACTRALAQASGAYSVLVVPLLVESGAWLPRCARIVVVDCLEATQAQRVQARSQLDAATIARIMQSQAPRSARLAAADDVIFNESLSLAELQIQAGLLHARNLRLVS